MEMMSGGELFDYVVEKGTLSEEEASVIVRKITSAVAFMHNLNIIHRLNHFIVSLRSYRLVGISSQRTCCLPAKVPTLRLKSSTLVLLGNLTRAITRDRFWVLRDILPQKCFCVTPMIKLLTSGHWV